MLFSQSVFLFAFLPAVLVLYYLPLRGRRRAGNLLLLLASLLFYGWGEPRFVGVMVLSIAMNYGFGLWCARRRDSLPAALATVCNLALLFVFKYLAFTIRSLNALGLGLTVPVIGLPIGISFFTFQAMSYVLDVARGRAQVQRSPLDLGLYIAFFPQLIAGPIVKYSTVAGEIQNRRESWADFSSGCVRFLTGLGKKVLIANTLASAADRVFALDPGALTTPMAWLGSLCYSFQIYYDFSGYSDMAIGLGRMFGFHFEENFRWPYAARSVREFWRRWHISLSSWFRDYLYIPLGGNRVSRARHLRNLLAVWLLTGLWHGAEWTFVLWGLGYFLLLTLETATPLPGCLPRPLDRVWTLLAVDLLWVLFRSESLGRAWGFFRAMAGLGAGWTDPAAALWLGELLPTLGLACLFSQPFAPWLRERVDRAGPRLRLAADLAYALALAAVGAACAACLVKGTYNPFIYFRF